MTKRKMLICCLLGAALGLACTGCYRQDIRTITVNVPQMKSAECSKLVQDALGKIDGILFAQPDMTRHSIDVTYDSKKLAIKNIEFLIAGVGFNANDVEASAEARAALPAGCR